MLVLSRKVGEKILVPHCHLSVTILDIAPSRVRLGISAPAGVAVRREEVEKRAAAKALTAKEEPLLPARVLIADPDRFLLASYGKHLRERGAYVFTARTGLECLAQLRDAVPDVLVLEPAILWGGGEGILALVNEESALRPTVIMILVQGRHPSLLYRLSRFKVDEYQTKPLTAEALASRIHTLLSFPDRQP